MQEIVLIRGLPGSGKSTLAQQMSDTHVHVEADDYFMFEGRYLFDGNKIKDAHDQCYFRAVAALNASKSVVIANTFTMKWEMEKYYTLAASFGCNVRVIVARGEYQNVHGVPDEVI